MAIKKSKNKKSLKNPIEDVIQDYNCISVNDTIDAMMYLRHCSKIAREQAFFAKKRKYNRKYLKECAKVDAYWDAFELIYKLLTDNGVDIAV